MRTYVRVCARVCVRVHLRLRTRTTPTTGLDERQLQGMSGIARRIQWGGLADGADSVARSLGFDLSGEIGFDVRKGSKDTITF